MFQESLHKLRRICATKQVLLKSCTLSDPLLDVSLLSSSGDTCEGTLKGSKVCIEGVRADAEGDLQKVKEVRP